MILSEVISDDHSIKKYNSSWFSKKCRVKILSEVISDDHSIKSSANDFVRQWFCKKCRMKISSEPMILSGVISDDYIASDIQWPYCKKFKWWFHKKCELTSDNDSAKSVEWRFHSRMYPMTISSEVTRWWFGTLAAWWFRWEKKINTRLVFTLLNDLNRIDIPFWAFAVLGRYAHRPKQRCIWWLVIPFGQIRNLPRFL